MIKPDKTIHTFKHITREYNVEQESKLRFVEARLLDILKLPPTDKHSLNRNNN